MKYRIIRGKNQIGGTITKRKNKYVYDKIAKESECSIIKFEYDYEETLRKGYSKKVKFEKCQN